MLLRSEGAIMEKRTLEQLEAALAAVGNDLSPRVEEPAVGTQHGRVFQVCHRRAPLADPIPAITAPGLVQRP